MSDLSDLRIREVRPRVNPSSAVHPLRNGVFAKKMDCRVKPGNDGGQTVPTILHPFEREPI
jgi:hypothetical protein